MSELTRRNCTQFINFERLDDAINARKALNGREILGAEVGSVRIGFAKVPSKIVKNPFEEAANGSGAPYMGLSMPPDRQIVDGGSLQDFHSNLMVDVATNPRYSNPSPAMQLNGKGVGITHEDETQETATTTVDEWQLLMRELSGSEPGVEADVQSAAGEWLRARAAVPLLKLDSGPQSLVRPLHTTRPFLSAS